MYTYIYIYTYVYGPGHLSLFLRTFRKKNVRARLPNTQEKYWPKNTSAINIQQRGMRYYVGRNTTTLAAEGQQQFERTRKPSNSMPIIDHQVAIRSC